MKIIYTDIIRQLAPWAFIPPIYVLVVFMNLFMNKFMLKYFI